MASHSAAPSAVRPFLIRGHGGAFGQGGPAMLADQVSVAWADRVARALAPVRDVSRDDSASMIPDSARLLDLIHMPDPSADLVLMAWQKRGRTTKVSIGVSADGLYILDLSADGPHGLIAGTTGAGKSELLQTIIAVLCVANRPDAMTFVLIDYKGGSAFKDCARLPHTVGMVSDLDGHLTVRALDSLGAELKRREEMLPHAGAKDIEDYWDTRRLRPELNLEPMPRLVLVIDEFAAMVAELPDFVHGLIDIARRGRSLGVHLLLATQRPAGVVSADIRANTNLRIALRVTSSDESADVIDAPDSAYIAKSTPGRCYVRSGASNLVAVQSARIGGRRPGTGPVAASAQVMTVPWHGLGRAMPAPAKAAGSDEETMATDLSVLVDAIATANPKAGLGPQRRPWLEPLPEVVTLGELPASRSPSTSRPPPTPWWPTRPAADGPACCGRWPTRWPRTPQVLAVLGSDLDVEYLRATVNPLDRYVVLVDDAEMLYNAPNSEILEGIIVSGRDADHGLVLAGTTADLSSCYSGFIATARKSRCGVLVAVDTPDDGDLFGVRLPRNAGLGPLGRGLLFRAGRAAPIQLAVDEGAI